MNILKARHIDGIEMIQNLDTSYSKNYRVALSAKKAGFTFYHNDTEISYKNYLKILKGIN